MSGGGALAALAVQVGLPLIRGVLEGRIGARNAGLAADMLAVVASRAGVAPADLDRAAEANPPVVIEGLRAAERAMPELLALHDATMARQMDLLQAEMRGPWWGWAWRPLTMWLLAFLWLWNVVILHVANAVWRIALPPTDLGILFSLTAVYMALYMGGHTVKDWVRVTRGGS